MRARNILNKLKWHPELELHDARVTILHRGAPNNLRVIEGSDIKEFGRGFMSVASPEGEMNIPYHRILRIEVRGQVLWKKHGL